MLFEIISVCNGGGYKYCRTNPLHPNANSSGLYPLHRVLMENKIYRLLTRKEIVHHKDNDKSNNTIENLELLSNSVHSKLHSKEVDSVEVMCARCNKIFYLKPSVYRRRLNRSKCKKLFHSIRCSVLYQHNTAP